MGLAPCNVPAARVMAIRVEDDAAADQRQRPPRSRVPVAIVIMAAMARPGTASWAVTMAIPGSSRLVAIRPGRGVLQKDCRGTEARLTSVKRGGAGWRSGKCEKAEPEQGRKGVRSHVGTPWCGGMSAWPLRPWTRVQSHASRMVPRLGTQRVVRQGRQEGSAAQEAAPPTELVPLSAWPRHDRAWSAMLQSISTTGSTASRS